MNQTKKQDTIDKMRMKDIISQLTDIIYLMCDARNADICTIINKFTNLTDEEIESLHICFSSEMTQYIKRVK